jgi:hypothetical protein
MPVNKVTINDILAGIDQINVIVQLIIDRRMIGIVTIGMYDECMTGIITSNVIE